MARSRNLSLALVLFSSVFGCQTGGDEAVRDRLESWWRLYQQDAEEWPSARDQWYALGGDERDALVMTLVRDMVHRAATPVRTERGALEPGWKRAQRELLRLPADGCVPVLSEALRAGNDPVSLEAISDTLAGFGAIDELEGVLSSPRPQDTAAARRFALLGLVKVGGEEAVSRVGGVLRNHESWEMRSAAADALGAARYTDRERAATVLVQGLEDADPFVLRKACESLAKLGVPGAAPAVAIRHERAARERDDESAKWTVQTLRVLTGTTVPGDDPNQWRQAAQRAASQGG